LFREQIRRGGPITVTHRDIVRYFMTIPEAAELVIQAGSMAQGGDVFVLDMGEPVKIYELARRMVTLAGLTIRDDSNLNGDIAIQITGLRPGEKLYEELLVGSNAFGTEHPRILRAMETSIPFAYLKLLLSKMQVAIEEGDCVVARNLLLQMVDSYKPELAINDLVWQEADAASRRSRGSDDKVARISPVRKDTNKLVAGSPPDRRDLK
jgi:FlaA1/EpsC-like NDP-sugar epimerase